MGDQVNRRGFFGTLLGGAALLHFRPQLPKKDTWYWEYESGSLTQITGIPIPIAEEVVSRKLYRLNPGDDTYTLIATINDKSINQWP
jgi:hypothetical protein